MVKKLVTISIFLEKEIPFIKKQVESISNINFKEYKVNVRIFNFSNNIDIDIIKKNFKLNSELNTFSYIDCTKKIVRIKYDDIEFHINEEISASTSILEENDKITSIIIPNEIYYRLSPFLDEESEKNLLIDYKLGEDVVTEKIVSKQFLDDNFLQGCDTESNNSDAKTLYKNIAINYAINDDSDYYLYIDEYAFVTNPEIFNILVSRKKDVICPLLTYSNGTLWSNFWGDLNEQGYYKRSRYYIPILLRKLRNIWTVKYVNSFYILSKNALKKLCNNPYDTNLDKGDGADMAICYNLREAKMEMFADNKEEYGWLIFDKNMGNFKERKNKDLYQFDDNRAIWNNVYLTKEFRLFLEKGNDLEIKEPEECRDLYEYDMLSEIFCEHLISECEFYGKWSNGGNKDERLSGGYENVPTRDIHMKQIGLGEIWKKVVIEYIGRVAAKQFNNIRTRGYNIAFVVRYTLDTQTELKPHHDAAVHSSVTVLNRDFEGGGTYFERQKYLHKPGKIGSTTLHPGRCTHFHSGKPITSGTRYILVSFNE